jgi:hypothetical protein
VCVSLSCPPFDRRWAQQSITRFICPVRSVLALRLTRLLLLATLHLDSSTESHYRSRQRPLDPLLRPDLYLFLTKRRRNKHTRLVRSASAPEDKVRPHTCGSNHRRLAWGRFEWCTSLPERAAVVSGGAEDDGDCKEGPGSKREEARGGGAEGDEEAGWGEETVPVECYIVLLVYFGLFPGLTSFLGRINCVTFVPLASSFFPPPPL